MKLYLVEFFENFEYPIVDITLMNISSSFENVICFLKKAIEDTNSGIKLESEIQISTDVLDSYFGTVSTIGRMTVQEWFESSENISELIKNVSQTST